MGILVYAIFKIFTTRLQRWSSGKRMNSKSLDFSIFDLSTFSIFSNFWFSLKFSEIPTSDDKINYFRPSVEQEVGEPYPTLD